MRQIQRMNIVITGASRGLGKAIAQEFAKEGTRLLLGSLQEENLSKTANELANANPGCEILYHPYDAKDKQEVLRFGDWVLEQSSSIDILVNNAGIYLPGCLHNEPDGNLEALMDLNFYSAYHLTRKLIPGMIEKKSGHIFNMCSIASINAYANGGAYSVSKFALYGFSKNLREEMKQLGIKVTHIIPGATYTDSWASSGLDPERFQTAEDIAKMIWAAAHLSPRACPEEIVLRPQLGDI